MMTEVAQVKVKTPSRTPRRSTRRGTTNVHKIMGNRLRAMRITLGISQQDLGARLGVSFQQVQKYEKGVNRIDAGRLIKIADVLGCSIEDFFEGLTERRIKTGVSEHDKYLASREGQQLITAMLAIERTDIRRRFIRLIEAVGGTDTPADEPE